MVSGRECTIPKEQVIQSLKKCKGRITYSAKDLGIDYRTLRRIVDEDLALKEFMDELCYAREEKELDAAEEVLLHALDEHKKNMKNALSSAMFILNNRGKKRGYNHPQTLDNEKVKEILHLAFNEIKNRTHLVVTE